MLRRERCVAGIADGRIEQVAPSLGEKLPRCQVYMVRVITILLVFMSAVERDHHQRSGSKGDKIIALPSSGVHAMIFLVQNQQIASSLRDLAFCKSSIAGISY